MRSATKAVFTALVLWLSTMTAVDARVVAPSQAETLAATPIVAAQQNCMSLSQAIDSVRRRGNVERVISAETRVSGGREVHHIKVLTKDGKVRTHKVPGCGR